MKKGVKISLWSILGIGILVMAVIVGPEYKLQITYPAACWTDDGKQIVYLQHRKLCKTNKLTMWGDADDILQAKTYLCIMDADGRNKKEIGDVPHPSEKEEFDNAMGKYEEGKIFFKNFLNRVSADNTLRIEHDENVIGKHFYIVDAKQRTKIIFKMHPKRSKSYLFIPFWWRV